MRLLKHLTTILLPVTSLFVLSITASTVQAQETWRLLLDDVRVDRQRETSGDRPYFNVIYFRSRLNSRGSTVVEIRSREPNDWVSKPQYNMGLPAGQNHMFNTNRLPIPWWMGQHEWRNVRVNPPDLTALNAEIYGAIIVSLDNNNTPPHVVRGLLQRFANILTTLLQEQVESGRIIGTFAGGDIRPLERRLQELVRREFDTPTVADLLFQLTVGSTFNPDQPTGIHVFLFPTISGIAPSELSGSIPGLPGGAVNWRAVISSPTARAERLTFSGSGAQYSVQSRFVRDTLPNNTLVSSLTIRIRTGEDNLESHSRASAFVSLCGREVVLDNFNRGRAFGNRSDDTITFPMPPGTRLGDIQTFGLRHVSGRSDPFYDNWNVDAIAVNFSGSPIPGSLLIQQGNPLQRFTGSVREWRMATGRGTISTDTVIDSLQVTIRTGGDDLRANSQATAFVRVGGRDLGPFPLNAGRNWGNNTTNTVTLPTRVALRDVESLRLQFASGSSGPFDTGDNWNVDAVTVNALAGCNSRTLTDRRGTPLVRFTGSTREFIVSIRP